MPTATSSNAPAPGSTRCSILTQQARQLVDVTVRQVQLGALAYHRVLKLSRTIADLDACDEIDIQARRRGHPVPAKAADLANTQQPHSG